MKGEGRGKVEGVRWWSDFGAKISFIKKKEKIANGKWKMMMAV